MGQRSLTLDQWAQAICLRVSEVFPQACVKHKFEDMYRWTYGARECQVHAVTDDTATIILLAGSRQPNVTRHPERVSIETATQAEIAQRIIGWFRQ